MSFYRMFLFEGRSMQEINNTIEIKNNFGKFNEILVVEKLPLPKYDTRSKISLYSKIYLFKNYEYNDELGMGIHSLRHWKELIENSNKKEEFYNVFRVNTKPRYLKGMTLDKPKIYYDKKIGVNFKFNVECNYSFNINNPLMLIKSTAMFNSEYSFKSLYKFINNELSSSLLSFITKSLLDKDISILEFNTYTKEFGALFIEYANKSLFNNSGIEFFDFNFVSLSFVKDEIFLEINKTLYEKADMLLRDYNYKDKSKYNILFSRRKKVKIKNSPVLEVKEGEVQ